MTVRAEGTPYQSLASSTSPPTYIQKDGLTAHQWVRGTGSILRISWPRRASKGHTLSREHVAIFIRSGIPKVLNEPACLPRSASTVIIKSLSLDRQHSHKTSTLCFVLNQVYDKRPPAFYCHSYPSAPSSLSDGHICPRTRTE